MTEKRHHCLNIGRIKPDQWSRKIIRKRDGRLFTVIVLSVRQPCWLHSIQPLNRKSQVFGFENLKSNVSWEICRLKTLKRRKCKKKNKRFNRKMKDRRKKSYRKPKKTIKEDKYGITKMSFIKKSERTYKDIRKSNRQVEELKQI